GLGAGLGDTRGVTDITHRRLRASEAVVDLALPLAQVLVDPVAGRDAARGRQGNEHERHAPCHDSSHCESSCPGVDVSNGPWIGAKGATPEPDRKRRFPRAREFAASRVAVREALRALEHRGLVEVRQGSAGGYFIREVDDTPVVRDLSTLFRLGRVSLAQLAEARALIEPESARLAASRITDHELKTLGACLEARTQAGLTSRRRRGLDAEFHRTVVAAARNPVHA